MDVLWAVLLVFVAFACWTLNVVGLPGNWLTVLMSALYAFFQFGEGRAALGWPLPRPRACGRQPHAGADQVPSTTSRPLRRYGQIRLRTCKCSNSVVRVCNFVSLADKVNRFVYSKQTPDRTGARHTARASSDHVYTNHLDERSEIEA